MRAYAREKFFGFLAGVKDFLQELKKLRELKELSQMFYPKFS